MNKVKCIVAACALSLLSACGGSGEQGQVIASDPDVINQQLDWATTMQGERISIDGYIWMTDSTEDDNGTVQLLLHTGPQGGGTSLLTFSVSRGTGANEVFLDTERAAATSAVVDNYSVNMANARFSDNAGTQHAWSQRVRLSGTVEYVESFEGGYSKYAGPGERDYYAWTLEDIRLDVPPTP